MGHVVMENRNGLVVATELTPATGTAEREAAIAMIEDLAGNQRITLAADKAYDTADFVAEMRRLGVTPHVTQNTKGRRSAIDGHTARHAGYTVSLRVRKRIEEVFGWIKTTGGIRKTRIAVRLWSAGCSLRPRRLTTPGAVGLRSCWLPRRSHPQSLSRHG